VTPHASFLGLRWDREAVLTNLDRLRRAFDLYSRWGFRDSVNIGTGVVSPLYLALDRGMIMAAIGNEFSGDVLPRAFSGPDMRHLVRPVIGVERFND